MKPYKSFRIYISMDSFLSRVHETHKLTSSQRRWLIIAQLVGHRGSVTFGAHRCAAFMKAFQVKSIKRL